MSDRLDFLRDGGEVGRWFEQQRQQGQDTQDLFSPPNEAFIAALRTLLAATAPTCLFWGQKALAFCNDQGLDASLLHPQTLGQPAEKVWGKSWAQRGAPIRALLESTQTPGTEAEKTSGNSVCLPLYDSTGSVVGVLESFFHASTQDAVAASAHADGHNNWQTQIAQLNHELLQASRTRDKFVSVVSHELRTPLTALSLRLQRMQMATQKQAKSAPVDPRLEQFLGKTDECVARMNQMIDEMVDAMRIGKGQLVLQPEPIDLVALIHQSLAKNQTTLEQDEVQVCTDLPMQLPVCVDAMRMQQVFSHLFDNVTRYAPGGTLTIGAQASKDAGFVRLWFCDDGPGVESEQIETIFEKFTQVKPIHIKARRGRLGLGLYMVRKIIEKHQGAIHAQRVEPQGLRVVMEFPSATSVA